MEVAINVQNIKKTLGGREVLKGVTFQVEKGDIFGFLGPNGAGKTTTIRTVMGLYSPDSGSVEIMGKNVTLPEVRRKIGFSFEPDGQYERMTARENLPFYLKLYNRPVDNKRILNVLDMFSLKERADDYAGTFSKGMRQRLTIARALVPDAEIMILDEPTSGVDPVEQMKIRSTLIEISQKMKKTIFLSTHNMDEVQRICNRIAILNKGQIQLTGNLSELRKKMGEDSVTFILSAPVSDELKEKWKKDNEFKLLSENGNEYTFASDLDRAKLTNMILEEGIDVVSVKRNDAGMEEMYKKIIAEGGKGAMK